MENNRSSNKSLWMAIGSVLILVVAALTLLKVGAHDASSSTSGTTGAASAGAIQYTLTPLRVARGPEGQITVEAEVVRQGSWNWRKVSVESLSVTGQPDAIATLISELPTDPIPERFGATFLCEMLDGNQKGSHLTFSLKVNAAKHFGLSNAGGQRTHTIALVATEATEGLEPLMDTDKH